MSNHWKDLPEVDHLWHKARAAGMSRRRFLQLAGVALASATAACAPGGQAPAGGGAPSTTGQEEAQVSAASPPSKPTGELVLGDGYGDPNGSLDPIDTFLLTWGMFANNIYNGLVFRDEKLQLGPGLATEWEYLDNKTLKFILRQGVKFHNGEPFNADAVVFTFERLLGPEGAKGPQQANYTSIDHVEKVDDFTVVFHLNTVDPVLVTKLAGYGAMIVPPKYLQEKGDEVFNVMPVGTGPFRVTEYVKDDRLVMEAYEDYWDGPPYLQKVTYRFIREDATRLADFQTGAIDIMQNVPVSQAEVIQSDPKLTLLPVDSPTVVQLRIDTTLPPTDDVRIRKAINYAIDVDTIIETVLGGYGRRISSFQSSMSFGYDPNLEPYPYDPEQAKALLQEANFKEGTELTITFSSTDSTFKEVVQAVASYLSDVGFKPVLNPVEAQTLFSDLIPNGKAGNLWQFGWGGWTLDFDNTAYLLYHEGEYWNPTFSDPRVEELLTRERTTLDQEVRQQAFHELARLLTKELVVEVDLYQVVNLWAINDRVHGFVPPPDDRVNLHKVWVTQ